MARRPIFDEEKTTQAAVLLLKLNGGRINYMKLIKLLYNIDREALRLWNRPVTFDTMYAMPRGMVLSNTLDKAEAENPAEKTYWNNFIQTKAYENILVNADCGESKLSPAEVSLIKTIDETYKSVDQYKMGAEHKFLPEYIDPKGSSIHTPYENILSALGMSKDEIEKFLADMDELAEMESLG